MHQEELGISALEHQDMNLLISLNRVEQSHEPADQGAVNKLIGRMVDDHPAHAIGNSQRERAKTLLT